MTIEAITIPPMPPFPNNSRPLLVYRIVVDLTACRPEWFERTFASNGWTGSWRNGVYSFHHFHAEAHEVLGCYAGSARVLFGGPEGREASIHAGDAVMVPAGVGHCLIDATRDFAVVGAYPSGTAPDLRRGREEEYQDVLSAVAGVPNPAADPVLGGVAVADSHWADTGE